MSHNNVPYYRKDNWRKLNLKFYLANAAKGGFLTCSYLELLGLSGRFSFDMVRPHLRDPKQFIGIDNSVGVILSHRGLPNLNEGEENFEVPFKTVFERDAYNFALRHAQSDSIKPAIGIFNFDDTNEAGDSQWDSKLDTVFSIAKLTVQKLGYCAMVINATVERPYHLADPEELLSRHADKLFLRACNGGWKGMALNDLKGKKGDFTITNDMEYVGGFSIYKSEGQQLKMATIRLFFTPGRVVVFK
jgi:hypothetical protein